MKEIEEKKVISPELEKKMKDMLTEFDSVFVADRISLNRNELIQIS